MLLERTETLLKALNDFKNLQSASNESQQYNKRNDQLKASVNYLDGLSEIVRLFREEGFNIDLKPNLETPFQMFIDFKNSWLDDKQSITKPSSKSNDFFSKIDYKSLENEIKSKLDLEWQGFIEDKKPSMNFDQLNVLEKIPDLSDTVSIIKEKLQHLNTLKQKLPSKSQDFEVVIALSMEMNALQEQLSSNNIPDTVIHFLKKAGTIEGVDLAEITPDILAWLQNNNLIHMCHVRFRK